MCEGGPLAPQSRQHGQATRDRLPLAVPVPVYYAIRLAARFPGGDCQ